MTKIASLLLLRVSLGGLLLVWGVNKILNVDHSRAIAENFYSEVLASGTLLPLAGAGQILIGLLVIIGLARRWVYPLQLLLNGASLLAVSASVIDPWGWFLEGTNVLFYPSLIIFAGSLVVMAFREEDRFALDARHLPRPASWVARRNCGS
ncbi:DoxX family protein [Halomonas sp. EGI 63088]|uniref:DoxX family protein n=1 Tax=Halomonas flagellata TaxID=2920385 RepID=A0ABS9RRC8_9GAMM|nr:DoxX family protein [Halomonas flagellata]MCH4562408.1 DoxX family protein [Halomonas flagellata]